MVRSWCERWPCSGGADARPAAVRCRSCGRPRALAPLRLGVAQAQRPALPHAISPLLSRGALARRRAAPGACRRGRRAAGGPATGAARATGAAGAARGARRGTTARGSARGLGGGHQPHPAADRAGVHPVRGQPHAAARSARPARRHGLSGPRPGPRPGPRRAARAAAGRRRCPGRARRRRRAGGSGGAGGAAAARGGRVQRSAAARPQRRGRA